MRSIGSCYSEHALKIADSYCSGHSNHALHSPNNKPSIQNTVTCVYKSKLSNQKQLLIAVTWSYKLIGQGIIISINDSPFSPFKLGLNSRQFRKIKGTQKFESCNLNIDLFWDLSKARYDSGPEPKSGFSVIVLVDSELCLLLGDAEQEIAERTVKNGIPTNKFFLVSRQEKYFGGAIYKTKAKFSELGECHDILIKCGVEYEGLRSPVLSVWIDNKNSISVKRLHWNFRGNQIIIVDGMLVDMMWDVHDWFFNSSSPSSRAVFLFRKRSGLDSRLWLDEERLLMNHKAQERSDFSLLICACKYPV